MLILTKVNFQNDLIKGEKNKHLNCQRAINPKEILLLGEKSSKVTFDRT